MSGPTDQSSIVLNNAGNLIRDLWDFVENVTDADPARTDKFFALRERVRKHYADFGSIQIEWGEKGEKAWNANG